MTKKKRFYCHGSYKHKNENIKAYAAAPATNPFLDDPQSFIHTIYKIDFVKSLHVRIVEESVGHCVP